ncbi:MAG: FAD-dependent oxidoreductase [Pirellulaceae bacterium]
MSLSGGLAFADQSADKGIASGSVFAEPTRQIDVVDDCDVIVCGGGPAGFGAAIAAARAGARARLFDVNGCLGGVWTAGMLTYIFDIDKPGLPREITRRLDLRDARVAGHKDPSRYVYHVEEMKCLLEEMVTEEKITVQLHTRVVAAYKNSANRLETIVTESKSGRQAWRAKAFIDATGDGDLGALAGCGWEFGEQSGPACPCQPMTMNALITVPDIEAIKDFILLYKGDDSSWSSYQNQARQRFLVELKRAGVKPSYGVPTLFHMRGSLLDLMANHEYGIRPFDAAAVSDATIRARAEIDNMVRALRSLGGIWEGIDLVATAEQIGIRDGRRIKGRYQVTQDDLVQGARHKDAIARVTFGVDVHAATKKENEKQAISKKGVHAKPYDIPLRALIAKDVDGLMMAGRCISGDFLAHASYRVTGNAVAMGEAAGAVSALSARDRRPPHEVEWAAAKRLLKQG